MPKIHLLSTDLINKIAAGEVVERPASVVKELIENSIDAKATHIKIDLENGGLSKINIVDDGEGMDPLDLHQSIVRHATSKISSIEDLERIASFGFRGEALSSITAVSILTLKSKTVSATMGNQLVLRGGAVDKDSSAGIPTGTQILVQDLFFNVPARKKFMKSIATELRYCTDIVMNAALVHPDIAFTLSHNKHTLFDLPKKQIQKDRIASLFGKVFLEQLIPVLYDHPHVGISGFISKPQTASPSNHKQYLFVNDRPVHDKIISGAIKEAYGTLLPPRSYPSYIVFLKLPPDMVDVNVHPRKEEVKFVNTQSLYSIVKQTVSHALQKHDVSFQFISPTSQTDEIETAHLNKYQAESTPSTSSQEFKFAFSQLRSNPPTSIQKSVPKIQTQELFTNNRIDSSHELNPHTHEILQIHNVYLLTQTAEGLLITDQHAAHERILYEQFLADFKTGQKNAHSQPLLISEILDLTTPEAQVLTEQLDTYSKLGFEIEPFGQNSFKITAIPQQLTDKNISKIITEVLSDLLEEKPVREIDNQNLRAIAYLACRSAVMAGDILLPHMRKQLVETIPQTPNNATCPHGRPTRIIFSKQDLDKMFKRM